MATSADLLTVEASADHEGGSVSDYFRSDGEETVDSTLERKFASLGKNDSLKSTRSLSVFRDKSATKTMARSEEMTYNIYQDIDIDGDVTGGENGKSGGQSTYVKSGNKSSGGVLSRGAFQLKQSTSPSAVPSISSPILHDENFKANLANSLTRKLSSESSTQQNGTAHLVSMNPSGGRSTARGTDSASSTLESTGSRPTGVKARWNALSSASSTTTLNSIDGAGGRGGNSETDTDTMGKQGTGYASDASRSTRDVVSYSVSRYSPAEVDTSNSLVRDKNFRAKMAALFSGRASPVSMSAPASLVRSKKTRDDSDAETESRDSTLSRDMRDVATPIDSLHSTLEGRASVDARSVRSTTPSDLRDVITTGSVSKMAGELALRGVPLTGRSMDSASSAESSLERPTASRASDHSGVGGSEKKGLEPEAEVTRTADSDDTMTAESDDQLSDGGERRNERQQLRTMNADLLRDLKRGSDVLTKKISDQGQEGERDSHPEANCSQEEMNYGNRNSQIIEERGLSLLPVLESDADVDFGDRSSEATEGHGLSSLSAVGSVGHVYDAHEEHSESTETTETNSVQREPEEAIERLDSSSISELTSGLGGAEQSTGNDVTEATTVSVEITDGSETGQSYNLEEISLAKFEKDSHSEASQSIGPHVLTLRMTSDDEKMTSHIDDNRSSTSEEATDKRDDEELSESATSVANRIQRNEHSNDDDVTPTEVGILHVPKISRRSNYEKIKRPTEKSSGDESNDEKSRPDGATVRNEDDDVILRTNVANQYESMKRPEIGDSPMQGRSRGVVTGRQKTLHRTSNDSTTTGSFLSRNGDSSQRTTEPESGSSSFQNGGGVHLTEQPRRNVIITGRDNIRRIVPVTASDASDSVQNGNTDREETTTYESQGEPRPTPRMGFSRDDQEMNDVVSRSSSLSFDPRITSENAAEISFSSDESPDRKPPIWIRPNKPETEMRSAENHGGLVVKLSSDYDTEIVPGRPVTPGGNERRSRGSGDYERLGRSGGIYEPNRRRSRPRKLSRQVTDSSLTDQEDYENAGNRSSVMRRRMKRQISRQSIEGDYEDPGTVSEPEVVRREGHVTKTTTTKTPVTGLISNPRSRTSPYLASDPQRPPSAPLQPPPSSITLSQRRSVTPVTGRISVTQGVTPRTEFVRTATPVTGLIGIPPSGSGSTPGLITATHPPSHPTHSPYSPPTHSVIVQHAPYSPSSPTGNTYLRSAGVLSPENPELVGIDPELRDAQKTGNIYHITMCIRPIISLSRPGSAAVQSFEVVDTAVRSYPGRTQSITSNGPRTSWVFAEEDIVTSPSRTIQAPDPQGHRSGRASQNQVGFHLELQGGEQTRISKETVARRASPRFSNPSENGGTRTSDLVVDFGRTVDVTEADEYIDEKNRPTRKKNREKLPEIKRGSILIKNRIDTSRPQIIDVITTDDDDVDGIVDDNSNMFHENYLSRKENPLYASNPDLNKWDENDEEHSEPASDPVGVRQGQRSPRSPDNIRGTVARGVRRNRSSSSDPISRMNKMNGISPENGENEGTQRREWTSSRYSSSIGATQRNGGNFGGKFNGYSGGGSSLTATVTRHELSNGSRNDEQEEFHDPYKDDIFDTEIKVNRDYHFGWKERSPGGGQSSKFASSSSRQVRSVQSGNHESLFASGSNGQLNEQTISTLNIRSLMVGSSSSVKQTIKVNRLDDEILSELPADELRQRRQAAGSGPATVSSVFDFDKVSEQVVMDVIDGKVILTSTARSERIVPIMGADDLYKKMAVIVTKKIELDMTVTPQRRQLYEMIKQRNDGSDRDGPLDKKATFELYKKFAALADLDRAMAS